jgi:hypothetical protein
VEVPDFAAEDADSVNVLLPLPGVAMLVWVKLAVTPLGGPLTASAIAELNPFTNVVVNVIAAVPPGASLAVAVLGVRVKLGAVTVTLRERVRVRPPPVPAKVKV